MKVIHFVIGRPKQESKNGIVKVVYELLKVDGVEAQCWSLSKNISEKQVGLIVFRKKKNRLLMSHQFQNELKNVNYRDTIFHFHGCLTPEYALAAKQLKELGITYVVSVHGMLSPLSLKRNFVIKYIFKNLLDKAFLKNATAIYSLGKKETLDIKKYLKCDNLRVIEIPNGVQSAVDFDLDDIIQKCPDVFTAIFIGRLDIYQKGIDVLLDTFVKVRALKLNLKLKIYGPDHKGSYKKIEEMIKSKKIEEIVTLNGPIFGKEKQHVLNSSDIFIQSSRAEGMPLGVLEAMASGLLCLTTKEANLEEVFTKYKCGATIKRDPDVICKALSDIISDSSNIRAMRGNAIKAIKAELNWRVICNKYAESYFEVLGGKYEG